MKDANIIIASTCGQLCSQVVIWPSEVLKLKQQMYPNQTIRYIGRNIWQKYGWYGFTTGFGTAAIANVPKIASQFYFYDMFRHKMNQNHVTASALSGCVSSIIATPLYNMTTHQVYNLKNDGRTKWSFWYSYNGIRPAMLKNCMEIYTTFLIYELLGNANFHPILTGGTATSLSSFVTNPIDVVKTTLQIDYKNEHKKNMLNAIRYIYSNYGVLNGFYAGCFTRMIRAFPGGAVRYYVFDKIMDVTSRRC